MKYFTLGISALLIGLMFSLPSLATTAQASTTQKDQLKIVPNHEVCMVTNAHFGRMQIPVEHSGKTYYGCCENCKTTLAVDQTSRTGKDALTGESVDKAKAVIAAKPDGSVLYFANLNNFKKYQSKK